METKKAIFHIEIIGEGNERLADCTYDNYNGLDMLAAFGALAEDLAERAREAHIESKVMKTVLDIISNVFAEGKGE